MAKGGIREAAKMLAGLGPTQSRKLLQEIALKDPQMAQELEKSMLTFEDLKFLTVKMLSELLREINIDDLALGLRLGSDELKEHILGNVSQSVRDDIEQILLGKPQPLSNVEGAIAKVMKVVREKIEKGQLVINREDGEEFV